MAKRQNDFWEMNGTFIILLVFGAFVIFLCIGLPIMIANDTKNNTNQSNKPTYSSEQIRKMRLADEKRDEQIYKDMMERGKDEDYRRQNNLY